MVDVEKTEEQRKPSADTYLPVSRVRTIMKSSMDTGQISNEVVFLITKCTELFVQHFAREANKAYCSKENGNMLKYEHLSQLVNKSNNMEFLLQIVPQKIRVHEFQELLRVNRSSSSDEDDESDFDSEEPEDDE